MFICLIYQMKNISEKKNLPKKSERLRSPNWHFPQLALASGLNPPTTGTRVVNLRLDKSGRAGLIKCLIWNELIIKFKFSFKNLLKIRIEIKLGMTGPARLRISAGPGRYGPRFQLGRAGLGCGQKFGYPRIYNSDRYTYKML